MGDQEITLTHWKNGDQFVKQYLSHLQYTGDKAQALSFCESVSSRDFRGGLTTTTHQKPLDL